MGILFGAVGRVRACTFYQRAGCITLSLPLHNECSAYCFITKYFRDAKIVRSIILDVFYEHDVTPFNNCMYLIYTTIFDEELQQKNPLVFYVCGFFLWLFRSFCCQTRDALWYSFVRQEVFIAVGAPLFLKSYTWYTPTLKKKKSSTKIKTVRNRGFFIDRMKYSSLGFR